MNKIKIAYIIADSSQTGAPLQVKYLCESLNTKYEIHCLCPAGWLSRSLEQNKIKVHLFDNQQSRSAIKKNISDILFNLNPYIIHCHGVRGGLVGRLARRPDKSKMIYTEHLWTPDFHLLNPVRSWLQIKSLKYLSKNTDWTIAVSQATQKFLIAHKIATKNNSSVIYGAIESIKNSEVNDRPIIGTLGSITWVKGIDLLIQSMPVVLKQFPKTRLLIGGDGPDHQRLSSLTTNLKLSHSIELLGKITKRVNYYHSLKLYIQPSYSESFGMAPLEAMSAGIPTIASNAGALPEIIENYKNGLIFKKGNAKDLTEKIILLLKDRALCHKLSKNGRDRANEFSISKMAHQHDLIYQKVLDHLRS